MSESKNAETEGCENMEHWRTTVDEAAVAAVAWVLGLLTLGSCCYLHTTLARINTFHAACLSCTAHVLVLVTAFVWQQEMPTWKNRRHSRPLA
jgi:hypothetical protein